MSRISAVSTTAPILPLPNHAPQSASANAHPTDAAGWSSGVRDAVAAARLPRDADPTARAAVLATLEGGQLVQGSEHQLDLGGTSGTPSRITLQRADGSTMDAFTKPAADGDARELLGQSVAERFGIGYLTIPTVERNGQLTAAFTAGVQGRAAGVHDADTLRSSFRSWYEQHAPQMTDADKSSFARIETELTQTLDYVLAMPDRHSRNVMVDPAQHATHLIDFNSIGIEMGVKDPLRPYLTGTYQPTKGASAIHLDLGSDTLAFLRKRITPNDMRTMAAPYTTGASAVLTTAQADHMAQRLEHVLTTGSFDAQHSALRDFTFEHIGNIVDKSPLLRDIVQKLMPKS